MYRLLFFLGVLFSLNNVVLCDDTDLTATLTRLRRYLLSKDRSYDTKIRPVRNRSTIVQVTIQMKMIKVLGFDMDTNSAIIESLMNVFWVDGLRRWDPADYNDVKSVQADESFLWMPNIVTQDRNQNYNKVRKPDHGVILLYFDGLVVLNLPFEATLTCILTGNTWPTDEYECYMFIISSHYTILQQNLTWDGITVLKNLDKEWELTLINKHPIPTISQKRGHSRLVAVFNLKRKSSIYLYFILIPYICAITFGFAMFIAPVGSILRFIFAGCALAILFEMLHAISYMSGINYQLTPYSGKCVSISILTISIGLILSSIMYHILAMIASQIPSIPPMFIDKLKNPLLKRALWLNDDLSDGPKEDAANVGQDKSISDWIFMIRFIDRLLLIVYIIVVAFYHS